MALLRWLVVLRLADTRSCEAEAGREGPIVGTSGIGDHGVVFVNQRSRKMNDVYFKYKVRK